MMGRLSYQAMAFLHLGHRERGLMTDSPAGQRQMQTLQKLPTMAPRTKDTIMKKVWSGSMACAKVMNGFLLAFEGKYRGWGAFHATAQRHP